VFSHTLNFFSYKKFQKITISNSNTKDFSCAETCENFERVTKCCTISNCNDPKIQGDVETCFQGNPGEIEESGKCDFPNNSACGVCSFFFKLRNKASSYLNVLTSFYFI
jgi:hypothetical protein